MKCVRFVAAFLCLLILGEFNANCLAGTHEAGLLGKGKPWQTPYYIHDSGVEGPTVVITGGVHGNEPAGARAAEQIRHWPIIKGRLIVVPRANPLGLKKETRFIPDAADEQKDLNRNFPTDSASEKPRGDIATALWAFVKTQNPDWLFDLHEGYEFNISHQPKPGKKKSVGSSIIFRKDEETEVMIRRMQDAVNQTITNPDRKFTLLGRGPVKTSLANAAIERLKIPAMILETTFSNQRLHLRIRQHRMLMNVALQQIGLIDRDCVDIMTPPARVRHQHVYVATYDDEGCSENGVRNVTRIIDRTPNMTIAHLGADDIRPEIVSQFDVIVFSGGSGSKQARSLGLDGAKVVRSFVKDGGGYVGICGGAYLCSADYKWSLNLVDTDVFTGAREIEGVGRKQMWYRGTSTNIKMELSDAGRTIFKNVPRDFVVRYHNGPIVSPKMFEGLKPYETLAWFRSEQVRYPPQKGTMVNTPAIVMGEFGEGEVISISPHPEATKGLESMITSAIKAVLPKSDQ